MSGVPAKRGPVGDPRLNLPFYAGVKPFKVIKEANVAGEQRNRVPNEENNDQEPPALKKSRMSLCAVRDSKANHPTTSSIVLTKETSINRSSNRDKTTANADKGKRENEEIQRKDNIGQQKEQAGKSQKKRKKGTKRSNSGTPDSQGSKKNANLEPLGKNLSFFTRPRPPGSASSLAAPTTSNSAKQHFKSVKVSSAAIVTRPSRGQPSNSHQTSSFSRSVPSVFQSNPPSIPPSAVPYSVSPPVSASTTSNMPCNSIGVHPRLDQPCNSHFSSSSQLLSSLPCLPKKAKDSSVPPSPAPFRSPSCSGTERMGFSEYPTRIEAMKTTINRHKGIHYFTDRDKKEIFEATDKVFKYSDEIYQRALKYRYDLESCMKDLRKMKSQFDMSQMNLSKVTEEYKAYMEDVQTKLASYENLLRKNEEWERKVKNLEKNINIQQSVFNNHMEKSEEFRKTAERKESYFNRLKTDIHHKDEKIAKIKKKMTEITTESEEKLKKVQEQLKVQVESRDVEIQSLKKNVNDLQETLRLKKKRKESENQKTRTTMEEMKKEIDDCRSIMITMNEKYSETNALQMKLKMKLKMKKCRIKQLEDQIKEMQADTTARMNPLAPDSTSIHHQNLSNVRQSSAKNTNEYNVSEFSTTVPRDSNSTDLANSSDKVGTSSVQNDKQSQGQKTLQAEIPPSISTQPTNFATPFVNNTGSGGQPLQPRMGIASHLSLQRSTNLASSSVMNLGSERNLKSRSTSPKKSISNNNPTNFNSLTYPPFYYNTEVGRQYQNIQVGVRNAHMQMRSEQSAPFEMCGQVNKPPSNQMGNMAPCFGPPAMNNQTLSTNVGFGIVNGQNSGVFGNQFSSSCGMFSNQNQIPFYQFQQPIISSGFGFSSSMPSESSQFITPPPPSFHLPQQNEVQMPMTSLVSNESRLRNQRRKNQVSAPSATAYVKESMNNQLREFLSTISEDEEEQRISTPLGSIPSESSDSFLYPPTPSTKAVCDVVQSLHNEKKARGNASMASVSEATKSISNNNQAQNAVDRPFKDEVDGDKKLETVSSSNQTVQTVGNVISNVENNTEKSGITDQQMTVPLRSFNINPLQKEQLEELVDQQQDKTLKELLKPQQVEPAINQVSNSDYYFQLFLNVLENRDNPLEPDEAERRACNVALDNIDEIRSVYGKKRSAKMLRVMPYKLVLFVMLTEIKETVNFIARYLRFRVNCLALRLFSLRLASEILVSVRDQWEFPNFICQIPCCNYGIAPEILKACKYAGFNVEDIRCHLPQIVFTLRPGYVTCEGGFSQIDRKTIAIWSGDTMSDCSYDPGILASKVISFPPQITYSSDGYGNVPFGKVIVDIEYERYSEVAYLSDEMMSKYQIYLFINEISFDNSGIALSEAKFTDVSYNRNCNPTTLMTVAAFHKTRFGSFREIPGENPRPPTVEIQSRESGYSTSTAEIEEEFPPINPQNSKQTVPVAILKDLLTPAQLRIIERLGYCI